MSSNVASFRQILKPQAKDTGGHCLIVGEVAQSHDGSLGMAHAFVDAIADAGADAIKFQTHIADAESTPAENWRIRFSKQDASRYDYWKRMEWSEDQWLGLKQHAEERDLLFLSSPFSLEAANMLERIGIRAWKVASGETCNVQMIDRLAQTRLPILLSTGMSPLSEIDSTVDRIRTHHSQLLLMQCTSAYPCPPERIGLNLIPSLQERYGCAVGLSDHSGTIYPGLAATTLGIEALEVHVALSREMFGPDVPVSVTTCELAQLVVGVRFIERMLANPIDKDKIAQELSPLRELFTKSVVLRVDLPSGSLLSHEHLQVKKPGTGIPAAQISQVIGARLKRNVRANELLREEDLERVEA